MYGSSLLIAAAGLLVLASGAVALVWGASVIADSTQFSTAITELSELLYRGTTLTFQTGLSFALTVLTIWLALQLGNAFDWGTAWAVLAIGPALGTVAILRLRSLPESLNLAVGRR